MKRQTKKSISYIPVNAAYFLQNILHALTTHMHETLNLTDKPPFLPAVVAYPGYGIFSKLRRKPVEPLLYPGVI